MSYSCSCCSFRTNTKFNMHRHFTRKINCQLLLENMSITNCFQTVLNVKYKNDFE